MNKVEGERGPGLWGPHVGREQWGTPVNNLNRPVCGYMETVSVNRLADRHTDD